MNSIKSKFWTTVFALFLIYVIMNLTATSSFSNTLLESATLTDLHISSDNMLSFEEYTILESTSIVTVIRDLPDYTIKGSSIIVTLTMDVDESNEPSAIGLTEIVPNGWSVANISPVGMYTSEANKIEWFFWALGTPIADRVITYQLDVPKDALGTYDFLGTIETPSTNISVEGDTSINVVEIISVSMTRELPENATQGSNITVTLTMDIDETNPPSSVGIIENVPEGWIVINTSSMGAYTQGENKIEWIFDSMGEPIEDTTITYTIQIPDTAVGTYYFNGSVSCDYSYDFGGDTTMIIVEQPEPEICTLPGDDPPCGEVTLSEVVDFITSWTDGQSELSDVVALITAWSNE